MLGAWLLTGCGNDSAPTTPTPTTTTTVNPPSVTEVWENSLAVGGTRFYSFTVGLNGTVNVTLERLTEGGADSTAQLNLGTGLPAGTGCNVAGTSAVSAGPEPQVSTTSAPGVYCARVSDPGNLALPASFRILIAHP